MIETAPLHMIIYRLECEQIEALRFFDIDKGIHNDTQKYNMLMFCLLGISSMLTCLNRSKVSGLPLIVFWADNIIDAYKELTDLFANGIYRRESETIKTEKEISALYEQVDCFIPIIVDKAVSPRNFSANKQANCLIIANNARQDTIATSLPVIITSDPSLFKNMSAMVFRYNSIIIKHSNAVYNCFRQYVLKNNSSSMIPLETQKDISIEKRFFSEKYGSSKATLYMLLKYVFLWFVIQDVTANNSFKYIVYLNNLFWSDNNSGTNAERFCKNLVSCKELTRVDRITATEYSDMCMYLDRNGISMSLDTFKFLAKKSLCDADMLKEELKNKGLLVIDTGTYQKNISICGKVRNVYCISQSALYGKYNVVMCSNEFIDKAPDYKLRLGVNNDTEIYYTFDSVAKADNQHCFVFGNSGCGKTTLLKSMICEAARNNFECLVIDAKLDYSSFSGEHFNHIRFGDKSGYTLCSTINAESIIRLMQCIGMHLTSSIERKIKLKCDPIARKTNYAVLKEYLDDCYLMLSDDPKTEELAEMIFELGEHPICRGKLLDWQSILQKGKAVIFDLPYDQIVTDDEALSNIADTVLQSFFMYKRTKNPPLEERIPCMVFIDEVKNYKIGTKSAISNILSQGRSSNIAAVLATQYLSADNGTKVSAVIGQCNTVVSFGTAESSYAVKVLECSSEEKKEMADALRELSVGEAIVYSKEKTVSTDTSYVHNYLKVRFNDFCSGEYPELFVSSRR